MKTRQRFPLLIIVLAVCSNGNGQTAIFRKDDTTSSPWQVLMTGTSDQNIQMISGVNTTAAGPYASLQSFKQGAGPLPLVLQNVGGNVGIGISNPSEKLHVIGNILVNGSALLRGSGQLELQFYNFGSVANQHFSELIEQNGMFTGRFINDAYSMAENWLLVKRNTGTFTVNSVNFPSGNVGIGTTAPAARLDVRGNYSQNSYGVADGVSEEVRILSAGNGSLEGGVLAIGGSWGPTGYIKTAAYNGAAGALIIGNRRSPTDTVMQPGILLDISGNVGIGTTNPTQKLSVNGTVRAKEVIVETTGWPDYVLARSHTLTPLSEIEQHIEKEGHLPGIPSAQEVADKGIGLGEMQAKLLAKIEELTLHQIAQGKELTELRGENLTLRARVTELESVLSR